ncbi:MAG TPA: hypothetical protein VGM56_13465 [Byssovorax sp.]
MSDAEGAARSIPLACLADRPAPPGLADDILAIAALPVAARQQLRGLLSSCLGEDVSRSIDADVEQFSRLLGLEAPNVARGLKASRFLVRSAALADLDEAGLTADLRALGDTGAIAEAILPVYEAGKVEVRRDAARAALTDHGKLVEHVDWRLDYVATSNRGENLKVPVVVLTMRYREGDTSSRVTLHLLPESLVELRAMCDRLL